MTHHVTVHHAKTGKDYLGIVTDDGRCRVDFFGDLSELTVFNTVYYDPKNPHKGGLVMDQRFDLILDIS